MEHSFVCVKIAFFPTWNIESYFSLILDLKLTGSFSQHIENTIPLILSFNFTLNIISFLSIAIFYILFLCRFIFTSTFI